VDYLAEVGKDLGFRADIQVESLGGVEQANLLLFPRGGPPRDKLMLQTHLDTVDPGIYSMWTKTAANPFNASIYNRELFGLGSADTKLDFLCKMFATGELCGRDLKRSFVLVGTYGAQSAMAGAIRLIRKRRVAVKYALVGEPTGLRLMGSGQGLAVVEVRVPFSAEERKYRLDHDTFESSSSQSKIFSGKAAHSTVPHLGESAIIKMFQFLENLPEGIAIMELDGGLNYNSIPANAYLEFDLVGGLRNSVVNKIMKIWTVVKELSVERIKAITEKIGGVIVWGGGVALAPGDDKIIKIEHPLALDPEGQVIASVMAKKFAVGAKFLVIDIPVGPDMKVESRERAETLARRFVEVGKKLSMRTEVILTDGTEPVGHAFGPALEAKVALETLEGKRFDNLGEKACELAGLLLELCGKSPAKKGMTLAKNLLKSGKASKKMQEILKAQNGRVFKSEQVKEAKLKETVLSDADGEITSISVRRLVEIARLAGAPGDLQAGVMLLVDKGNQVNRGQPLLEIHSNNPQKMALAKKLATERSGIELRKVVLERIE
jgi:acetylornithine deacetylase/succinyl-diaminopimelate desuccinylase-like protein